MCSPFARLENSRSASIRASSFPKPSKVSSFFQCPIGTIESALKTRCESVVRALSLSLSLSLSSRARDSSLSLFKSHRNLPARVFVVGRVPRAPRPTARLKIQRNSQRIFKRQFPTHLFQHSTFQTQLENERKNQDPRARARARLSTRTRLGQERGRCLLVMWGDRRRGSCASPFCALDSDARI